MNIKITLEQYIMIVNSLKHYSYLINRSRIEYNRNKLGNNISFQEYMILKNLYDDLKAELDVYLDKQEHDLIQIFVKDAY